MRKPAFCIFCGLCILTSFSLLTVNVRGVSNKHCLLPFFIFICFILLQRKFICYQETVLGITSLSALGSVGAVLEIILILYPFEISECFFIAGRLMS